VNSGIVLLCIVATAVLYAGDLHLGFFRIDDPQYVVTNPWIQGITLKNLAQTLSNPYYLNYSPLHLLSYTLDHAVAGLNAYAFHLSSNLWAGVVAGFVYLVALALTQRRPVAVVAALLFIVHPTHVEAVAWISNRKDLVAAAFVLPCFMAYLKYRQRGAITWYLVSLLLFLFALLGKLSVAAFPAVLLVVDLAIEKRPITRSVIDKIPFVVLAAILATAVHYAQPSTGLQPDPSVHAKAFLQSLWLLTGLGHYVIYRVPPESGHGFATLVGLTILVGLFVLPWFLRKRYPVATVLIYWILFTYLSTQVLPFSYPVTDRYLFLPSVGAVILIAWLCIKAMGEFGKWRAAAAATLVMVVSLVWLAKTVGYLSEWRDPRSVWFAATQKSDDFHVYYELGWEYLEKAAAFGNKRRNASLPPEEAKYYASVAWKGDPRLPELMSELARGEHNGPTENSFKEYLQTKAAENFDHALAKKGEHITPALFFSRGVFFVDKDDMQSAKKEFQAEIDEASSLPDSEARQEPLISGYYNLAVVEERLGHSKEALTWIRLAEEEQNKLGRTVIPEITAARQKLESRAAKLP
jgi:tetratricopeptide (TPR) repeat protein